MGLRLTPAEKQAELTRHKAITIASLDYMREKYMEQAPGKINFSVHFENLKLQVEDAFNKGQLSKMKQWLHDITDEPRETEDNDFDIYIKTKTGYDFDVSDNLNKTLTRVIKNKRIKTENDYRDIMSVIDKLCQIEPVDDELIELLNQLLRDFETAFDKAKSTT